MKLAQAQPRVTTARYLYLMFSMMLVPVWWWSPLPTHPTSCPNSLSINRCFSLDGGIFIRDHWRTPASLGVWSLHWAETGWGRLSTLNDIDQTRSDIDCWCEVCAADTVCLSHSPLTFSILNLQPLLLLCANNQYNQSPGPSLSVSFSSK